MSSEYFLSLSGEVKVRYGDKLSAIDNLDPYALKSEEFSTSICDVPVVSEIDLVSYFTITHSYYTCKQLKAYKSLEAFKFYEAGFVENLECKKVNDNFLVRGEVKHSQRMNYKNLKAWIVLEPNGSILSAHCTCVAGLGEVCSHTAAIVFYLHARPAPSSNEKKSCTDEPAKWPVPSTPKKVIPKKISEIDWGTKRPRQDEQWEDVSSLEGAKLVDFLQEVNKWEPDAAILRVMQPFAAQKRSSQILDLPALLTELHNVEFEAYSLEDLREISVHLNVSPEQQHIVHTKTMEQSKCNAWFQFKAGRITASLFKLVCRTSLEKPSLSLIKQICYPLAKRFETKATVYGLRNENVARKEYQKQMESIQKTLK